LFSDLYLAKFLDISAKSFFPWYFSDFMRQRIRKTLVIQHD